MPAVSARWILVILGLAAVGPSCTAASCPAIDPSKGFFANFDNPCYALTMAVSQSNMAADLNAIYTRFYYQVNPAYELIVLGTFPNARFMSASVYDDHLLVVGDLKDSDIVPLTGQVNPFLPGASYKPNQMYGLTVSLGGGQPVSVSPGCSVGSSVDQNLLDASQIHQGITWAGYPNLPPGFPAHETGDNAAGAFYVRKYVDIDSPPLSEVVIVRSLANGCAIPIQQAEQMNIVSVTQKASSTWLHQSQINAHLQFSSLVQPSLDFPADPTNGAYWGRPQQYVALNDQDAGYLGTGFSSTQMAELLSGQVYLRLRFQLPTTPTIPCASGSCSLTGNEQVRYVGLTFQTSPSSCAGHTAVFSIGDQNMVKDPNGYVTIVAGFGAPQPPNVTAANYYTWIDLSAVPDYTTIAGLIVRQITPNPTFQCSTFNVPYKTSEHNPEGGYMGPYVPTVDFPTAAEIPATPVPVSRPNSCSLVPTQTPQSVWNAVTQYETCTSDDTLGVYSATVAPNAGSGSVQLTATGSWTAGSDSSWLQFSPGSAAGSGNATIGYDYLASVNPEAQTGTLTIAGLPFWLTQVGTSYAPVVSLTQLVSSGLNGPRGVAVDGSGDVYVADTGNHAIEEWSLYTRQATPLVVSGLNSPAAVAADTLGNVYIADSGNHAIQEFNPSTLQLTTLVSGLNNPSGVAVDGQGNVYFSDAGTNAIEEWNSATQQVGTLVASGLSGPAGVAVDSAGNVYFADSNHNAVDEWSAATGHVSTLVGSGLSHPSGVAVDGQGNVYIADTGHNVVQKWNAATQQVTILQPTAFNSPMGVAVDVVGNVYVSDTNNSLLTELMPYFVSFGATSVPEGAQAGSDSVSLSVLPTTIAVTATSNQAWLTVTGVSNVGTVNFSFSANNSFASRSAQISVLGQSVTVTQSADGAADLIKTAGLNQSTAPGQPFATNLRVHVTDSTGNGISGVPVTFSIIPAQKGASGTFSSSPPMPILTDANGRAIAPTLTANSKPGTFLVKVTAGGLKTFFAATITSQN